MLTPDANVFPLCNYFLSFLFLNCVILFIYFMLLNYAIEEDSKDTLDCKEVKQVHPKGNQS